MLKWSFTLWVQALNLHQYNHQSAGYIFKMWNTKLTKTCVIDKSSNPLGEISAWQMVVMHLVQVKNQEGWYRKYYNEYPWIGVKWLNTFWSLFCFVLFFALFKTLWKFSNQTITILCIHKYLNFRLKQQEKGLLFANHTGCSVRIMDDFTWTLRLPAARRTKERSVPSPCVEKEAG